MHPDDVRELFACIDAEPSPTFFEALLTRLESGHELGRCADVAVGSSIQAPILLDLRPPSPAADREVARPRGRRPRARIVAAVAAAAAVIIGSVLATRDDGVELETPPVDQPTTSMVPTTPTVPPSQLPEGLYALPPEGADPSMPAAGELVAELPMPIWVYEDGRVISALWSGNDVPGDWTGFLEQRLTPEGVELVRAEVERTDPSQAYCRPGGPGGYGFSDGGREVCAHATRGGWESVYPRLYELPRGAPSWLPATAWADPDPKPYVPSSYVIQLTVDGQPTRDEVVAMLPPAVAGVLAAAPECAFDIFPPSHGERLCWKVTTD
jgi:hypothetical protein